MDHEHISIHRLARGVAEIIRDTDLPDGIPAPQVFLDGIHSDEDITDAPLVVVQASQENDNWHTGATTYSISVLVAIDNSSEDINQGISEDDGKGVICTGNGDILEDIVDCFEQALKEGAAGAILRAVDKTWSFDSTPIQYCSMELRYEALTVFQSETF